MKKYLLSDLVNLVNNEFKIEISENVNAHEPHSHDFYEIVIVLGGSANQKVFDVEYSIGKGDVFVFSGDSYHGFDNVQNFHICNIMFHPNLLNLSGDYKSIGGFWALFITEPRFRDNNHYIASLKLSDSQFEKVRTIVYDMFEEYSACVVGYKSLFIHKLYELIIFLSRAYDKSENSYSVYSRLGNALAYMEENLLPLKLSQIAKISNFSTRHFDRLFRKIYNISPINYHLNLRLKKACELLLYDKHSITDIAYLCGFCDSSHFSKAFKNNFGISPLKYKTFLCSKVNDLSSNS